MSGIDPSHVVKIAGKKYKLRYTIYAADKIEQLTNTPFDDLLAEWDEETVRYGTMLTVLWAGLLFHHEDLDRDELAKMMTAKDLRDADLQGSFVDAIRDFFPSASETTEEPDNPPVKKGKGGGGRGKRSSKTA